LYSWLALRRPLIGLTLGMAKNSADVRPHHREIARFLLDKLGPPGTVSIDRTNEGTIPVPVGEFGAAG
jgi:hypothetical protein